MTNPERESAASELRETIENLHAWAANSTLVVAGLHALTGLVHHYVLRDGVVGWMLPQRLDGGQQTVGRKQGVP